MAGVGEGRVEAGGDWHTPSSTRFGLCLPQFLAMVFQDLLTSKDDYLRASRALLREIIKQTKHEINFQAFCLGLMQERKEPQYLDMEFKVRVAPRAVCGALGSAWRPVWAAVSPRRQRGSILREAQGSGVSGVRQSHGSQRD